MSATEAIEFALADSGLDGMAEADEIVAAISKAGYKIVLRNPCKCGCDKPAEQHLCPCGCGHTYEDAVRKVMGGPMFLNWEQASANIDENPDVPCKWSA